MTFWDQAFDSPHYKYGTEPNAFVREQARRLPPAARVLVPGDGEGRNGVWLAAQGHEVLSVDASALLIYRAAWQQDVGGTDNRRAAAMAKLHATEFAQQVIDAAVQMHGGAGVTRGVKVEEVRD